MLADITSRLPTPQLTAGSSTGAAVKLEHDAAALERTKLLALKQLIDDSAVSKVDKSELHSRLLLL